MHRFVSSFAAHLRLNVVLSALVGAALLGLVAVPAQAAPKADRQAAPKPTLAGSSQAGSQARIASAPSGERGRSYYGSITLNTKNAYVVWDYNYRQKSVAINAAYNRCRSVSGAPAYCRRVVWVRNACAALLIRRNPNGTINRFAWGVARTESKAIKAARKHMPHGRFWAYTCTAGR